VDKLVDAAWLIPALALKLIELPLTPPLTASEPLFAVMATVVPDTAELIGKVAGAVGYGQRAAGLGGGNNERAAYIVNVLCPWGRYCRLLPTECWSGL